MKLNNKGFTMVELLATMAVLAIIMLIAVPNIVGVVNKNKQKTLVEDAKKMISMAKYYVSKNSKGNGTYTLSVIDESKELVKGPNNRLYNTTKSKVVVNSTTYRVYLYETGYNCIVNKTEDALFTSDVKTLVQSNCS